MPNITHSIQEYCKKINSRLSLSDILSLFITAMFLLVSVVYMTVVQEKNRYPVIYKEGGEVVGMETATTTNSKPFGSRKGKTYTFSWCRGAGVIRPSNKVYFKDEEEAQRSGRVLSKLCS